MKKIVMVIGVNNYRDEELLQPREIFEKNGFTVSVASTSLEKSIGVLGAEVKPDLLVKDITASDFDAILFVGGQGATQYWNDPLAHKLAWDYLNANKIVAAICIAPVILAKAGILKGKRATVWSTEAGQILVKGAEYTKNNVEIDGNIITAAGPFAARQFAEAIIKAMAS
ncbi:MAG: DJ-1/PfpI family protein [Candidatus Omnitrophota bacterium]|jgi:protease I